MKRMTELQRRQRYLTWVHNQTKALRLCAPLIADELQAFEECHSKPGDTDGSSFLSYERRIWRRLLRAHAALVKLGILRAGRFKKRPATARRLVG